jgi:prepilin-type N-terminal cleavage/methylation domain-containing protein
VGRRGFSLVEVVVATALLGVGVTAVLGAYGAMNSARTRAAESERMAQLAGAKLDEIVATGEYLEAPLSGRFDDERYTWSAETQAGAEVTLTELTVRVTRERGGEPLATEARTMIFAPPVATGGAN